ncbi:MAG: RDD family protein [Mycobacteriales bacterium]
MTQPGPAPSGGLPAYATGGPPVVTGEAVALDLRLARLPSRALAAAIDLSVELVLLVLSGVVTSRVVSDPAGALALELAVLLLIAVGYPVGLETLWRGRTLGKAALGLRVVRDDGGPIGFRQALVRALTGVFLERPGISLFVVGVAAQLLSARGKRLGDVLAGTVVLQERVVVRGGTVAVMPPPLAGWAVTLDLSRLPDDLALSARQFLSRSSQLSAAAREDLGSRLIAAIAERVSPPPPPGTPGWAYLSAVLAERRRRDELRLLPTRGAVPQPAVPPPGAPPPSVPPPGPAPGGFAAPG